MEGTLPFHFQIQKDDSDHDVAVKRYIFTARVNINARQVFPPGFTFDGKGRDAGDTSR
jgi:alkylated DNA repair protein alkB family protein 1